MKRPSFNLKPHQACDCCKREIDQESTGVDKTRRLGLLEDGSVFCRRCAYESCDPAKAGVILY